MEKKTYKIESISPEEIKSMGATNCKKYFKKVIRNVDTNLFKDRVYAYGTVKKDYRHRYIVDTHADNNNYGNNFILVIHNPFRNCVYVLLLNNMEMFQQFPEIDLIYSQTGKELFKHKIKFLIDEHPNILDSDCLIATLTY